MDAETKFRIEEPSTALLMELGEMVDEIEDAIHERRDYRDQLAELNGRLVTPMTEEGICTYAASRSRDEFVRFHLTPNPHIHKNLTKDEMLWLIKQMIANVTDDRLLDYYSRILEINASCPEGTVMGLPEFQNMGDPEIILNQLEGRKRVFHL